MVRQDYFCTFSGALGIKPAEARAGPQLQDALARSEPDENLFAAAEVLDRLDQSEAENKILKAELARVSTILASRERELVKMKGLASPEDEVF